jgi:hypothetical protein
MRITTPSDRILEWLEDQEMLQHIIVQQVLLMLILNNYQGQKSGDNRWIVTNYTRAFDQVNALDQTIAVNLLLLADEAPDEIVQLSEIISVEIYREAIV